MNCPVDQSPLAKPAEESSGFHQCGACAGLWVDAAELRRLAGQGERHLHAAVRGAQRGDATVLAQAPRGCPGCGGTLRCYTVEGVELDVCPACHGLWLDAGELEAVRVWYGKRLTARAGGRAKRIGVSGEDVVGEFVVHIAIDVVFDGLVGLLDGV
jgi:uncharacterized protein